MLNPVINEIVALFAEVNVIEDPNTGLGVWAAKAGAIVEAYLPENSQHLMDWRPTFSLTEAFTGYVAELQGAW
jgi:hypothetical protein